MNTKEVLTANEIQTEISLELNNLVKTSFDKDFENKLSNLVNITKQLVDNAYEKISYLTDPIYADDNKNLTSMQKNSLEQILKTLFSIETMSDVILENIKPDDFMCLSALIYHQKQLNELNPAPIQKMGLTKDETDFLTK